MIIKRYPIYLMAKRHRCHGLSIKELRKINKHIAKLNILRKRRDAIYNFVDEFGNDELNDEVLLETIVAINRESYDLCELRNVNIPDDGPKVPHIARTIESFTATQCWERFRIRKEDLSRYEL
jgi:hypothetical protein